MNTTILDKSRQISPSFSFPKHAESTPLLRDDNDATSDRMMMITMMITMTIMMMIMMMIMMIPSVLGS